MPRDERFSARDKRTHKMTKDGLVEVNQSTGEEHRLSQRGQDFQMRQTQPDQQNLSARDAPAGRSRHGQTPPPDAPRDPARYGPEAPSAWPEGSAGQEHPPGFTETELPPERGGIRQNDAPIRPGAHTTEASSPRSSLVDRAHGQHPRAAPGDAPRKQRGASYQRRFAENAPAPEDGRSPEQPTAEAPGKGSNSPDAASSPPETATAPGHDPAPHGSHAPPTPRSSSSSEGAAPDGARSFTDKGHSRLRFGEEQPRSGDRPSSKRAQRGSRYAQQFAGRQEERGAPTPESSGTPPPSGSTGQSASSSAGQSGAAAPADGDAKPGGPKLKFSSDELPPEPLGKKLTNARRRAERIDGKLEKARGKLPTRRRPAVKKTADPNSGKVQRRLHFEKQVKTQRQHLKGPLPLRPVKAARNTATRFGHKKLYEVEEENVGTKAAHRVEMTAEGAARSAFRFVKTRPYRRVAKLQHKSMKANVKLSYQKALSDNPKLRSNPLARFLQKQRIKRQYAKAAREAARTGKRAGSVLKKTGDALASIGRAVAGFVSRHPMAAGVIALLLLLVFVIMTMFSSCSNMAGGGMSAIFMSSYTAGDTDIDEAELAYSGWEAGLQLQINNAETDFPDYDEYRYSVDDIGHNPYELVAYLTARYHDFTFADVEADLREIFAEQYVLEFVPEVEVRYDDPDDENEDGDLVPYDYHILHINLTARSFTDVVSSRLTADQREHYDLLMDTKGNRQYTLSPFDFDWIPYISEYYGWRVHPITGAKDNHRAVDIAVAEGTEIRAAHDGTITTATWHNQYGNYIALDDGDGLVTKYAHCSALLVSVGQEVKQGDVIALVGSTGDSTGAHLHFEVIKDGVYLNPLFFSETIDDGTGGAAPGTPGGPEIPDYPGAPMGDGSFAALMEEAQKHLGKPYVFGASGPDKFDCSGFVSYVLANSTHPGFGRTNAQSIYNKCTPVSRENAQPGDLIFFTGTYSTPNACSHIGIYLGNGQMIHCGKPVQYASIDTKYWQEHFYAFARLP